MSVREALCAVVQFLLAQVTVFVLALSVLLFVVVVPLRISLGPKPYNKKSSFF